MKKIEITDEEKESMNYGDIAYLVLENNKKKMKIMELFHEVAKVLGLDESVDADYISDFFELISTDKRFIMLENGYWDLKINHNTGMVLDEEDDDEEIIIEETDDETEEDEYIDENKNADDDIEDDDLADLVIVEDSEEESSL